MQRDARHADDQTNGVDWRDVGALDDNGHGQAEDLLDNARHTEGETRGVGDKEVLSHLHEEGNDASEHDPGHSAQEQSRVLEPEHGERGGDPHTLECYSEGKEDNDHDWLNMIDHIHGVGQTKLGLLHDQL